MDVRNKPLRNPIISKQNNILDDPDFVKTGDTITKQLINIHILIETKQYTVDIYRNYKTGEWYHAPFPAGLVDDVNYGGTVKAFLYLLNHYCCVSIDKTIEFLSDLTGGKLHPSNLSMDLERSLLIKRMQTAKSCLPIFCWSRFFRLISRTVG